MGFAADARTAPDRVVLCAASRRAEPLRFNRAARVVTYRSVKSEGPTAAPRSPARLRSWHGPAQGRGSSLTA